MESGNSNIDEPLTLEDRLRVLCALYGESSDWIEDKPDEPIP